MLVRVLGYSSLIKPEGDVMQNKDEHSKITIRQKSGDKNCWHHDLPIHQDPPPMGAHPLQFPKHKDPPSDILDSCDSREFDPFCRFVIRTWEVWMQLLLYFALGKNIVVQCLKMKSWSSGQGKIMCIIWLDEQDRNMFVVKYWGFSGVKALAPKII